jgi:hypothetical protein
VLITTLVSCAALAGANGPLSDLPPPLTIPHANLPTWLRENGIVMAHDMEPFIARVKVETGGYVASEQTIRRYEQEHSVEVLRALKELGVNFIMTHGYKGAGLAAEKPDMEFTKRFIERCHQEGLPVGTYIYSSSMLFEVMTQEIPESKAWLVRDYFGYPVIWCGRSFRYWISHNHPDAQAYLKRVVDYAVREMKADLLHFDNYYIGPGYDPVSVAQFREYLRKHDKPIDFGLEDFGSVMPPAPSPMHAPGDSMRPGKEPYITYPLVGDAKPDTPLNRAWLKFRVESLAASYAELARFARSINPNVLVELNPGGVECDPGGPIKHIDPAVDHGRLLRYGEAFWDEFNASNTGYSNGVLTEAIRTYRMAQTMDNIVFTWCTSPTQAAEQLAFNTDCLGSVVSFLDLKTYHDGTFDLNLRELLPFIRFFHDQRPYYRYATRINDIASLRSFASQVYLPERISDATYRFEQHLIDARTPWALIYDQHTGELERYRVVCLVGADALSEEQVAQIRAYAKKRGGLVLTESSGQYDEKINARPVNPFADLHSERIMRVKPDVGFEEAIGAVRRAYGGELPLVVRGPSYLQAELTEQRQQGRRLVHLVNYNQETAVEKIQVNAQVPLKWQVGQVKLIRVEQPKPEPLEFRQENDRVTFTVPCVKHYALISVEKRHAKSSGTQKSN